MLFKKTKETFSIQIDYEEGFDRKVERKEDERNMVQFISDLMINKTGFKDKYKNTIQTKYSFYLRIYSLNDYMRTICLLMYVIIIEHFWNFLYGILHVSINSNNN
jgi:hypothetical protein